MRPTCPPQWHLCSFRTHIRVMCHPFHNGQPVDLALPSSGSAELPRRCASHVIQRRRSKEPFLSSPEHTKSSLWTTFGLQPRNSPAAGSPFRSMTVRSTPLASLNSSGFSQPGGTQQQTFPCCRMPANHGPHVFSRSVTSGHSQRVHHPYFVQAGH